MAGGAIDIAFKRMSGKCSISRRLDSFVAFFVLVVAVISLSVLGFQMLIGDGAT